MRHLVDLIRRRFPQSEVRFLDTVCKPTKDRQSAAVSRWHARATSSSWSAAARATTRASWSRPARLLRRVHHVEIDARTSARNGSMPRRSWTDGRTSTPDDVIDRVEARIRLCATLRRDKSPGRGADAKRRGGAR